LIIRQILESEKENWYGMNSYITDGRYIQLQDTEEIQKIYPPIEGDGMYPQALLQVFIRQGSGQISKYAIGNRKQSESPYNQITGTRR
jgi:hypothetical protein